jgi:hypothetical protein
MKNHLIIFSLLMTFLSSCMNNQTAQNEIQKDSTTLQNEGFTEMQIIENRKTSCIFLLQDSNKTIYEAQDLSTKIPNIKAGNTVWIKFSSLRRISVCNAQPISITEVLNSNN